MVVQSGKSEFAVSAADEAPLFSAPKEVPLFSAHKEAPIEVTFAYKEALLLSS